MSQRNAGDTTQSLLLMKRKDHEICWALLDILGVFSHQHLSAMERSVESFSGQLFHPCYEH